MKKDPSLAPILVQQQFATFKPVARQPDQADDIERDDEEAGQRAGIDAAIHANIVTYAHGNKRQARDAENGDEEVGQAKDGAGREEDDGDQGQEELPFAARADGRGGVPGWKSRAWFLIDRGPVLHPFLAWGRGWSFARVNASVIGRTAPASNKKIRSKGGRAAFSVGASRLPIVASKPRWAIYKDELPSYILVFSLCNIFPRWCGSSGAVSPVFPFAIGAKNITEFSASSGREQVTHALIDTLRAGAHEDG